MLRKIVILFFISTVALAQGGEKVYSFLNLPVGTTQAALGGTTLTNLKDVSQPLWNPATISSKLNNQLSINYVNYLIDINYFSSDYVFKINDKLDCFYANLTYVGYGQFIAADADGTETGTFKANDFALTMGYAKQIKMTNFYVGGNVKFIQSTIEQYTSTGIAFDLGLLYKSDSLPLTAGLVFRNIGHQLKSYNGTLESLPLQITAGFSYRLEHVPVKIFTSLDHLQRWKLAYANPSDEEEDINGEITQKTPSFFNNVLRHMVIGAELFPDKGFSVRLGYNFKRAQELKLRDTRTFSGLSMGFGLKIKRFKLNYAFTKYHPATDSHSFGLTINLNNFEQSTSKD